MNHELGDRYRYNIGASTSFAASHIFKLPFPTTHTLDSIAIRGFTNIELLDPP